MLNYTIILFILCTVDSFAAYMTLFTHVLMYVSLRCFIHRLVPLMHQFADFF